MTLGDIVNMWPAPPLPFLQFGVLSFDLGALLVRTCVLFENGEFVCCFANGLMEQRNPTVALSLEGKDYSF